MALKGMDNVGLVVNDLEETFRRRVLSSYQGRGMQLSGRYVARAASMALLYSEKLGMSPNSMAWATHLSPVAGEFA